MEPFTQNSLQTLIPTPLDKLLFILLYLKCYPTYDLQGLLFGLDRTRVALLNKSELADRMTPSATPVILS
ncbi:transposase family protein [Symbiopectobacterium purcellii]|uniref:transposase family protein n=1 Tax=Symbiopectobacterium purcellii TaxID=2871826 RepID=UPI003F876E26